MPDSFWPDGARLVISVSMQFEAGAQPDHAPYSPFAEMDPETPNLPTGKWFEYGVKEGIPRMLDLWDRKGIKVTSHMVGKAVEKYPDTAREIVERGHEAAAHGQVWEPHWRMTPDEERQSYEANIAAIEKAAGVRPVGFNAFALRNSPNTLEILQSLGFLYYIDDTSRDEPFSISVAGKPFMVVPYTRRNNDIERFQMLSLSAADFLSELKDEFDILYAEAGRRRRMMSVGMHDRIGGQPAVVKTIERFIDYAQKLSGVAFMRKDEIARWAADQEDTPRE
ncbi:MAG: polysaccharide deacetylase family protein [Alphaproteobacteria bacterium]|nr:polysaccharide deacetylase family protein [Alphaproteobacteria bacterium]MCZ6764937.1 polysaccharide deacetylase family protein [Alphaproteobacteria bacterium]